MSTPSSDSRVHAAVAAGQSFEEVRRVIDACAPPGDERARAEAVNESGGMNRKTPLQAAHRVGRGDLIGLLLGEGADASQIRTSKGRPTAALALCVCYDLPETLRALLRRKGHDPNQRFTYQDGGLPCASDDGCTLTHLCVSPPRLLFWVPPPRPRLDCLRALVREAGVSVDARDERGRTPLIWASRRLSLRLATTDLLVRMGADITARDVTGRTPILHCAERSRDSALWRRLLKRGASPDVVGNFGFTPLMQACFVGIKDIALEDVALELADRSSPETRRAIVRHSRFNGFSSVDFIARWGRGMGMPWQRQLIAKLLASGATVLPQHAVIVLPIAVSHGLPLAAKKEAELAARRPALHYDLCTCWRAHEAFAGLAMDAKELWAAEQEVEDKKRRVLELEMELLALGGGAESSGGSGSDEEESESESEEGESGEDDSDGDEVESASAGTALSGGGGGD